MKPGLLIGCLLYCTALFPQTGNQELYQQLIGVYLQQNEPFQSVQADNLQAYLPSFNLDSTTQRRLQILPPEIQYRVLDKELIERKMSVSLTIRDSVLIPAQLAHLDTLSLKSFRKIYRESPDPLQGDDPTLRARWIRPIGLISLSIATLVSLFYVRSS